MVEGFSAVSMDDLAQDLGISKKTLYKYFESKDKLIHRIAERKMATARLLIGRIVNNENSFLEKILGLTSFIGINLGRASKPLLRDLQRFAPDLWNRIETFRRERIRNWITAIIEQGKREGMVRNDVSTIIFLHAYLGAIDQVMQPSFLTQNPIAPYDAIYGIFSIFFSGVLTDNGRDAVSRISASSLQSLHT
jgi:AcrR family transcriptional regulator